MRRTCLGATTMGTVCARRTICLHDRVVVCKYSYVRPLVENEIVNIPNPACECLWVNSLSVARGTLVRIAATVLAVFTASNASKRVSHASTVATVILEKQELANVSVEKALIRRRDVRRVCRIISGTSAPSAQVVTFPMETAMTV